MLSEFSADCKLYAELYERDVLKIWDTASDKVVRKFKTGAPCACLHFTEAYGKSTTPRKKKKRASLEASSVHLAVGTTTGSLLVYTLSQEEQEFQINTETNQTINCLSSTGNRTIYGCVQESVLTFNLDKHSVSSPWRVSEENLTSILAIPKSQLLLTASHEIKLWDISTRQLIKTFSSQTRSEVSFLKCTLQDQSLDGYLVSGSKSDTCLNVWNLSTLAGDKEPIAKLALEGPPTLVSFSQENVTCNLAVVTNSGTAQIFRQTFNGKRKKKQLKPQVIIRIVKTLASSSAQTKASKIPIFGAGFLSSTFFLCHGSEKQLNFENVELEELVQAGKVQCWIRDNTEIEDNKSKVSNGICNGVATESGLENKNLQEAISLDLANSLQKALQTGNRVILKKILSGHDESVIKAVVKKIPSTLAEPFLKEITKIVQGHTLTCEKGVLWLQHFVQLNDALLAAERNFKEDLDSISGFVEEKMTLHCPLFRLNGKLDLITSKICFNENKNEEDDNLPLVNTVQVESDSDFADDCEDFEDERDWLEQEEEEEEEEMDKDGDSSGSDSSVEEMEVD